MSTAAASSEHRNGAARGKRCGNQSSGHQKFLANGCGACGGTAYAHLMTDFASRLEPEEEIESLAAYFAGRPARGRETE